MSNTLTAQIPLLNKAGEVLGYATVDAEDYARLSRWTWRLKRDRGYAYRGEAAEGRSVKVFMHRDILGLGRLPGYVQSDSPEGDHINGDRLDNRRANLRVVRHVDQQRNRPEHRAGHPVGFRWRDGRLVPRTKRPEHASA